MKINLLNLQDSFKLGYEHSASSRALAEEVNNLYHNRQFTADELEVLRERGQPAETFNIIKLFTRKLIGYYSTTINSAKAEPKQQQDIAISEVMNDTLSYVNRTNYFEYEGDKLKLDLFLTGLMCSYTNKKIDTLSDGTARKDDYGRPIYSIVKKHIPAEQVVIDHKSIKADGSDSRFIHTFRWAVKEEIKDLFPNKNVSKDLEDFHNFLDIAEADKFYSTEDSISNGIFTSLEEYLIVHSIIRDDKGDLYSVHWTGRAILQKTKLLDGSPFTIVKLHDSNKSEYYGIFKEAMESQKAINQAVIQIQLMANSNKLLVETAGAVANLEDFADAYKRVNAVVPVVNVNGIKEINLSGEIQQQYIIIDKALDRIQMVLGINNAFLGLGYANDSGRKVKLQQNATVMALRYINNKLELFYRLDGWHTMNLIKRYFRATQTLRIVDEVTGTRWASLNEPIIDPETNKPFMEQSISLDTGKPEVDEFDNRIMVPISDNATNLEFSDFDMEVVTVTYNDEDEKNPLMLETFLNGNGGQALMQVNPAGYFKAMALSIQSMNSKHSIDIAGILKETSSMLTPQPENQGSLGGGQQADNTNAKSKTLQIPKEG